MSFKSFLACAVLVVSMSAQAIPPVPPTAIYNKIRTIAARNCKTIVGEIAVSDLKDTDKVKFVLQLNKNGDAGILTVLSGGEVQDNLEVTCR
jgi:hypothetical protein